MGRNAKFYKSHKCKKKESSTQKEVTDSLVLGERKRSKEERDKTEKLPRIGGQEAQITNNSKERMNIIDAGVQSNKLKSKLWRDLEAKRAKEGKGEYSTPKEAGIDYLRQWEKRGR